MQQIQLNIIPFNLLVDKLSFAIYNEKQYFHIEEGGEFYLLTSKRKSIFK